MAVPLSGDSDPGETALTNLYYTAGTCCKLQFNVIDTLAFYSDRSLRKRDEVRGSSDEEKQLMPIQVMVTRAKRRLPTWYTWVVPLDTSSR